MRLFVDQLTNIDFSYLCPERGLVGETWLAHIELEGELNEQGMVCDFGTVKKVCRDWLDEQIDHRLLIPSAYEGCSHRADEFDEIEFNCQCGMIKTSSPFGAITCIPVTAISPASVATWCEEKLTGLFGSTVKAISVRFTTEAINGPFYHYSHGLKKHKGNCQRIAHGHRSKILIWQNGQLDELLMQDWANTFRDIYIGSRDDINSENASHYDFAYRSQQGHFSLSVPKTRCYIVDADTTVENIAQHIAHITAQKTRSHIKVKAFEGLSKGAITYSYF